METKLTSPAIKGVIISLILIVCNLGITFSGQMENRVLSMIPLAIGVAGIIWSCINYSNQMNNNVTFGNVFGHGFKVVAAITAIMALSTLLLFLVVKPELVDLSIEKAREAMEKRGTPDSDMNNAVGMMKKMFIPFAVIGVILIYGIGGTLIALIGAAVAKKNPDHNPTPFQQ
jgi:hypothetical protein